MYFAQFIAAAVAVLLNLTDPSSLSPTAPQSVGTFIPALSGQWTCPVDPMASSERSSQLSGRPLSATLLQPSCAVASSAPDHTDDGLCDAQRETARCLGVGGKAARLPRAWSASHVNRSPRVWSPPQIPYAPRCLLPSSGVFAVCSKVWRSLARRMQIDSSLFHPEHALYPAFA